MGMQMHDVPTSWKGIAISNLTQGVKSFGPHQDKNIALVMTPVKLQMSQECPLLFNRQSRAKPTMTTTNLSE